MKGVPLLNKWIPFGLLLGPLAFVLTLVLLPSVTSLNYKESVVIGTALWMVVWWVSESTHLAVTALLPLVLLPVTGVMDASTTASAYGNRIIFLFLGGFILALGVEKWGLHRRIALHLVRMTGTHANRIIWGFMLATGFLSMWLSNTATAVMMLPIGMSIVGLIRDHLQDENDSGGNMANFATALLLSIAYAANIGGTATIIGTPPNAVTASLLSKIYKVDVDFLHWLIAAIPFTAGMLWLTWLLLVKRLLPNNLGDLPQVHNKVNEQIKSLGKMEKHEKISMFIFVATAFLWIFRKPLASWFDIFDYLDDTAIAIAGGVAMFTLPFRDNGKHETVLKWDDTMKLPWGILILFGGGLALATGMQSSGLIERLAGGLSALHHWPAILLILALMLIMIYATELMSNVALTSILMPVVMGIAMGLGDDLMFFSVPVTLAASCAFMLPVSTPPNAIVFSSGLISVKQMVKAGFWLNLISVSFLMALAYWFKLVFSI